MWRWTYDPEHHGHHRWQRFKQSQTPQQYQEPPHPVANHSQQRLRHGQPPVRLPLAPGPSHPPPRRYPPSPDLGPSHCHYLAHEAHEAQQWQGRPEYRQPVHHEPPRQLPAYPPREDRRFFRYAEEDYGHPCGHWSAPPHAGGSSAEYWREVEPCYAHEYHGPGHYPENAAPQWAGEGQARPAHYEPCYEEAEYNHYHGHWRGEPHYARHGGAAAPYDQRHGPRNALRPNQYPARPWRRQSNQANQPNRERFDRGQVRRTAPVGRSRPRDVGREVLECGLTQDQVWALMHRDLTTDDYDLLLLLDESVPKKTATAEQAEQLVDVVPEPDASCAVCLGAFDGEAKALPCCRAVFHSECIRKWLLECKNACPHCQTEVQ